MAVDSANIELLRTREDDAVKAIRGLLDSSKWAALQILIFDLNLRPLTQVNIGREKMAAFRKELAPL